MPALKVRKHHRKKKHGRKHRHQTRHEVRREPVEKRQSWFGSLSLFFGLIGLFLLTVQGILWLQRTQGSPGAMSLLIYDVTRGEIVIALMGTILALLSFPFSSRRQRNAVLGFLLNVTVLGTWIYLHNWRYHQY